MGRLVDDPDFTATQTNILTRRAGRVRFFGDSITVGRGNTPSVLTNWLTYAGLGPATWAMLTSTSNFTLVGNSAVSGERSDQVLARIQAALLLKDADIFVVPTCTWNDRGQGLTAAQSLANIQAMYEACRANNVLLVLGTPTPDGTNGTTLARRTAQAQVRAGMINFCRAKGIPYVDLFSLLVDPATGSLSAAYVSDGSVHPNDAGYIAMGNAFAAVIDKLVNAVAFPGACYADDTTDLLAGAGLFLSNAGGVGTGWTVGSMPTGHTPSTVIDAGVLGKMQRLAASAAAAGAYIDKDILTGWAAGDVLELSGILTYDGGTSLPRIRFVLGGAPNPNEAISFEPWGAATRGRFRFVQKIPTGTTTLKVRMQNQAGTGIFDVGQLAVRNLTTLGAT